MPKVAKSHEEKLAEIEAQIQEASENGEYGKAQKLRDKRMRIKRNALPWQGDPPPPVSERPRCKGGCGKTLTPTTHYDYGDVGSGPVAQKFTGEYEGYYGFHSLRCALQFARSAYAHGYRVRED